MRKIVKAVLVSFLSFVFVIGLLNNTTVSAGELTKTIKPSIKSINNVASETDTVEIIDADQLPEGTQFIEFENMEEFEDFLSEVEDYHENKQNESVIELDPASQLDDQLVTMASTKSDTKVLKVMVKPSLNPIKGLAQPVNVTVDLRYKYTGSGSKRKFSSISKITSYSFGIPTDWVQTSKKTSFSSNKKTANITLNGYHLLGIKIGGQSAGAKFSDSIRFKYKIGGKTKLIAY